MKASFRSKFKAFSAGLTLGFVALFSLNLSAHAFPLVDIETETGGVTGTAGIDDTDHPALQQLYGDSHELFRRLYRFVHREYTPGYGVDARSLAIYDLIDLLLPFSETRPLIRSYGGSTLWAEEAQTFEIQNLNGGKAFLYVAKDGSFLFEENGKHLFKYVKPGAGRPSPFSRVRFDQNGNAVAAESIQLSGSKKKEDLNPPICPPPIDASLEKIRDTVSDTRQILIAIMDDGVDYNHPEIHRRLLRPEVGRDFSQEDSLPYDFRLDRSLFRNDLIKHHGTGVASVASKNSDQIFILPIRRPTIDRIPGPKDFEKYIETVRYAKSRGARIVNMSFQYDDNWKNPLTPTDDPLLPLVRAMSEYPDILFVTAAGNTPRSLDQNPGYPASYSLPNLITVAATAKDRPSELASFSSYGLKSVHLAAPGDQITAARASGGSEIVSGTSYSSPLVASVCAKIWLIDPNFSVSEVIDILKRSSRTFPGLKDKLIWGSTLDEAAALSLARARATTKQSSSN